MTLENQHLSIITIYSNKNHKWMLKLVGESLRIAGY